MFFSLDTVVMIAAVLGSSDTFHPRWLAFREHRSGSKMVVTTSVYSEYEARVEGIGRTDGSIGRVETIVRDLYLAASMIRGSMGSKETLPPLVRGLRLNQHTDSIVREIVERGSDPGAIADRIRSIANKFDFEVMVRKGEFLSSVSIDGPRDQGKVHSTELSLTAELGEGGDSWKHDVRHIAETHILSMELGDPAHFVTEDRSHFKPRRVVRILELLGGRTIQTICDLECKSLAIT